MSPLEAFPYRDGTLAADGVDLEQLAEHVGTPFYCYSQSAIERQYRRFHSAFAKIDALICYAAKANSNQAVLRVLTRLGAGMDVVSGGELKRAVAAGALAQKITFSGVGKTAEEISLALDLGIFCFNVESEPELSLISSIAESRGLRAPVALRVNPDVDARTHAKISTGLSANKFGIPISRALEAYRTAAELRGVRITGVDMHIGSQITELEPFDNAFALLADLVRELRAAGHALDHLDLGGGLGVPYRQDEDDAPYRVERYAEVVESRLGGLGLSIIFEPGRLLVANAGALVTQVLFVKRGEDKTFVIVDAAMNDLVRPTLYEAHHEIVPVVQPAGDRSWTNADVVGPVCETGDYLALDRRLQEPLAGELLAVLSAGAYGAVQAGTYNTRRLIPEVLTANGRWAFVRPRQSYEELIGLDRTPDWLL